MGRYIYGNNDFTYKYRFAMQGNDLLRIKDDLDIGQVVLVKSEWEDQDDDGNDVTYHSYYPGMELSPADIEAIGKIVDEGPLLEIIKGLPEAYRKEYEAHPPRDEKESPYEFKVGTKPEIISIVFKGWGITFDGPAQSYEKEMDAKYGGNYLFHNMLNEIYQHYKDYKETIIIEEGDWSVDEGGEKEDFIAEYGAKVID